MVRVIRYVASTLGAIVLLAFLAALLGQGPPTMAGTTTREALAYLGAGIGLVGLAAAYWHAGIGGALAVGGFLLHVVVSRGVFAHGMAWLIPAAGLPFLALWWAERRGGTGAARPPEMRRGRALRLAGRLVLGLAAFAAAWLAAEALLPAPLIATRSTTIHAVAGRWEGATRIADEWGPPGDVVFVLTVGGDGTAAGTLGAASFRDARLVPNRSWLGGIFHIRSDYRVSGVLSGLITPRYGIGCKAFALSLNSGPRGLDGRLTADGCERGGRNEGAMHAVRATFRKPGARTR